MVVGSEPEVEPGAPVVDAAGGSVAAGSDVDGEQAATTSNSAADNPSAFFITINLLLNAGDNPNR